MESKFLNKLFDYIDEAVSRAISEAESDYDSGQDMRRGIYTLKPELHELFMKERST